MENRIIENIKKANESIASVSSYDISKARLIEKGLSVEKKIELFKERAKFAGSKVHTVCCASSLKERLKEIIDPGSSVMSSVGSELEDKLGKVEKLLPDGCEYLGSGPLDADVLFSGDIAVTDVTLAVAETGSILVCADKTYPRMKSLVCKKHIALIEAGRICSDLMDLSEYLKGVKPENMPAGFNLISGPSKTADIELQLVIGVHGPAELHLIIIDN